MSPVARTFLLVFALACPSLAWAQEPATAATPQQWAMQAAAEQVHDLEPSHSFLRYRAHTVDSKGNLTRDVVESRDGAVARLISKEGRALTPEEDQAERERLQAMIDNPASFIKHIRNEQSSKKQAIDVIKLIPQAMLFTYTEGQPQPAVLARTGARPAVVLDFHPNPAWSPPTLAAETLTGLEGRLWIDPRTRHVLRLEAHVFKPVNVGFGVLARVAPGGTATLDEAQADPHRWLPSHFVEHITLRALMVKTYKENNDVENYNFSPVDNMSYQQAIQLLLGTPLPQ